MEATFYSTGSDGYIRGTNANYATARSTPTEVVKIGNEFYINQHWDETYYNIRRLYLYFDTSTLPDDATITDAKLYLYCTSDDSDVDFDIVVMNGQPTYPHDPLVEGDYSLGNYSGNGGQFNTVGMTVNAYNLITLNNDGKSWINLEGTTKLILLSSRDINIQIPTGSEGVTFYTSSYTTYKPKLIITYGTETGLPSITTGDATNLKANNVQGNAEVTDIGGAYTERGFEYGTLNEAMWSVRETGAWLDDTFSMTIPDLQPETDYYYRAFLSNSYGEAYGEWEKFTTTALPSYGIYEESNSLPDADGIYANSNTICFYVRRIGGKWSIKHGPYTKDQADIEIGKILTEGKGKYQIKFTSDVLTGLSVNIMTKLDIKART